MNDLQDKIARELREALNDDSAHSERTRLCREIAYALAESGKVLYVGGWVLRSQRAEAVGVLTEMAAELADGACSLLERELYYAAACVIRQLVEVQYFYFCFVTEPDDSIAWLNATSETLRKSFSPSGMRRRSQGRFRDKEYWTHCDLGGHPNPKGRLLLKNHSTPLRSHRFLWADLGQHLEETWGLLSEATQIAGISDYLPQERVQAVKAALARWHDHDLASSRLRLSAGCHDA